MQSEEEKSAMQTHANPLTDYSPQLEVFESAQFEPQRSAAVFSESEELELTSELLEISSEQELDQFLGNLISKAGKASGNFVKSPAGKAIGGVLKGVAKYGLPIAAGTVGTIFGGPIGGMVGSSLASTVTNAFGLELEGLSPEDREFEGGRQFVRFAGEAVKNILQAAPNASLDEAARAAAAQAAHVYAPGLLNSSTLGTTASGNWVRHGASIILYGI
jgi:hypothetical protein